MFLFEYTRTYAMQYLPYYILHIQHYISYDILMTQLEVAEISRNNQTNCKYPEINYFSLYRGDFRDHVLIIIDQMN